MDEPITGQTSGTALINMAGVSKNTDQAQLIDDLKKSLTAEMEKEYKLLQDLCDYCKPSKSEEKEKDKPVDDVKDVAAIKKFQNSPIAGSILIHHDFEKLFDILKGMTIGASLSSNNKKDDNDIVYEVISRWSSLQKIIKEEITLEEISKLLNNTI